MKNHGAVHELARAVLACALPAGARVLVALSGGADSVALLATVHRLIEEGAGRWEVRAGHVNHHLRGEESDADERFVRRLCADLAIEVDVARVDTAGEAARQRVGFEAAARELRYRELLAMLAAWPGDVLLTGHTADDQAETVLMRLIRGTGLQGLGGIRARTERVARPFLGSRHETVLAALQEMGLGYRLDSSNRDRRYTRNRVREDMIPVLEREAPRAVEAMARTAGLLQADAEYLHAETREVCTVLRVAWSEEEVTGDTALWRALHPSLRRSVLRAMLGGITGSAQDVDARSVEAAARQIEAGTRGTGEHMVGGLAVRCDGDRFVVRRGKPREREAWPVVRVMIPGGVTGPGGRLEAVWLAAAEMAERDRLIAVCGPFHALCDGGQIGDELMVRTRRPGDRLRPLGMQGSKKLQDILVDGHVPVERRDEIAVVDDGRGPLWIPGFALDQRAAVTAATERLLHLRFTPRWPGYRDRMPGRS